MISEEHNSPRRSQESNKVDLIPFPQLENNTNEKSSPDEQVEIRVFESKNLAELDLDRRYHTENEIPQSKHLREREQIDIEMLRPIQNHSANYKRGQVSPYPISKEAFKIKENIQNEKIQSLKGWLTAHLTSFGFSDDQINKASFIFERESIYERPKEEILDIMVQQICNADEEEPIQRNAEKSSAQQLNFNGLQISSEGDTFLCPICYTDQPKYIKVQPLPCKHFYCSECYINYLDQRVLNSQVLHINCPQEGCPHELSDQHIEKILSKHKYDRYIRLKRKIELSQNPNLRWCVRPNCEKFVIKTGDSNRLVCECGMEICFECGNEYHKNKKCDEAMNKAFRRYSKKNNIQTCKKCKAKVEKSYGCNHMTCLVCNYEWCWICGREYTPAHFARLNPLGCPGLLYASRKKWGFCKLFFFKLAILLMVIAIIALSPVLLVIGLLAAPNLYYRQEIGRWNYLRKSIFIKAGLVLAAIPLIPVTIVMSIRALFKRK